MQATYKIVLLILYLVIYFERRCPMSVSYDRLAQRIDDLIFELSLINSELNELRKRICLLEKKSNNNNNEY